MGLVYVDEFCFGYVVVYVDVVCVLFVDGGFVGEVMVVWVVVVVDEYVGGIG